MSQSPPPGRPGLAQTGTSPASGSAGPGPVSCTWMRIRPGPAQIRAVTGGPPCRRALLTASPTPIISCSRAVSGIRPPPMPGEHGPYWAGDGSLITRAGTEFRADRDSSGSGGQSAGSCSTGGWAGTGRRAARCGVGPRGDVQHAGRGGGGVVQAPAPDGELIQQRCWRLIRHRSHPANRPPLPSCGTSPAIRIGVGARGGEPREHLPAGGDRPGWRGVQAVVGDEGDGVRVVKPRPQQAGLAVVVAEDDRLARGHAFLHERDDQGAELGVGAVEPDLVEPPRPAGRFRPHLRAFLGAGARRCDRSLLQQGPGSAPGRSCSPEKTAAPGPGGAVTSASSRAL